MTSVRLCLKAAGNVMPRKSSTRVRFLFIRPRRWMKYGYWRANAVIKRRPCRSNVEGMRYARRILRPRSISDALGGLTMVCPHLLSQMLILALTVIISLIKFQSAKYEEEIVRSETCGRIT